MRIKGFFRKIALIISLIMMLTSSVQTTYGFITVQTDAIKNIFTPDDKAMSDIIISKTVEHPFGESYVIPNNIAFDFMVELGGFYANTTLSTTKGEIVADENGSFTVTLKPDEMLSIDGIEEQTQVKVTERTDRHTGFAVKGEAERILTVGVEQSAKAEFVNIYTPQKASTQNLSFTGRKILEGREWQEGDSFSFLVEFADENGEWTKLGTKTVTYDPPDENFSNFDFTDLITAFDFDKVGKYEFRISEVEGELDGLDYDKTVNYFTANVTDTDMDGYLEISELKASQNAKVARTDEGYALSVVFNNSFIPKPKDITVGVAVDKKVLNVGAEAIGPENFEFVLENITKGEKTAVKTDAAGLALFELTFTSEDVGKIYKYKAYELDDGRKGVTYSRAVYDISIAVSLGEDNTLSAALTQNGEKTDVLALAFENKYMSDEPPIAQLGDNSTRVVWLIIFITSAATFTTLLLTGKRKEE